MKLPIDRVAFDTFIEESNLFALTQDALCYCLKNWYEEEPEQFRKIFVQTFLPS